MESEITKLEEDIAKSVNEIAKTLELEYHEFVPSFLALVDSQDKIKTTLKIGRERLARIENTLKKLDSDMKSMENESPYQKLSLVRVFIDQLGTLNEIENLLNTMWLGFNDSAEPSSSGQEVLSRAKIVIRLNELCNSLNSDGSNHLEVISFRIQPLLFAEIATHKGELLHQIETFYRDFVHVEEFSNDGQLQAQHILSSLSTDRVGMRLSLGNPTSASNNFTAMQVLEILDQYIVDMDLIIWENFCLPLIHSNDPDLIEFRENDFVGREVVFSIKKNEIATDPDPRIVFKSLTSFFDLLKNSLKSIRIGERLLIEFLGQKFWQKLVSILERDCLTPAIPARNSDPSDSKLSEIATITNEFEKFMRDHAFFVDVPSDLFKNFFSNYKLISVDRYCQNIIVQARELVSKPYVDLIEVGGENRQQSLVETQPIESSPKSQSVDSKKSSHFQKAVQKHFQFSRCKISSSIFQFYNLFFETMKSAAESDSGIERPRFITTAQNMLELFQTITPELHGHTISTVPHIAAVFYNNCQYICYRLVTLRTDLQSLLKEAPLKLSTTDCNFSDVCVQIKLSAANALERQIANIQRQLTITLGDDQRLFVDLRDDGCCRNCKRVMNACVMQIKQVRDIWNNVMPDDILVNSIGSLVSHILTLISQMVQGNESIKSADSDSMADIFTQLMSEFKSILTVKGQPNIHRVCEDSYFSMCEIIFCLRSNLTEIGHRWAEGKGPLAIWLKPSQVRQLVRALFQNTDRRAQLLAQIV